MPDDDRHTRDRVRVLDPQYEELWRRARQGRDPGAGPVQLALPEEDVLPAAEKAFERVLSKIGQPDLHEAEERTAELARKLKGDRSESVDLCAGYRASGMQALLDQAVSVVLSSRTPDELLALAEEGELAAVIGEQFARGVLRRYSLDRAAPFSEELAPEAVDALDFLELADLTFTSSILRALAMTLVR